MADQTNAEVSDERLREIAPCPFCGCSDIVASNVGEDEDNWFVGCMESGCGVNPGVFCPDSEADAIDIWNRRSVTSQASEGAEPDAVAFLRAVLTKRATSAEFNEWQAREVVAYIDRLAPVSKRVERLETSGAALLELLDDWMVVASITANDRYSTALEEFRQALQGGRS